MSLDHDLGGERGRTGFDFVRRMAELDLCAPDIYVHSVNAGGRERMLAFIAAEDERRGLAPDRAHPVARPDDHTGCETTITCSYCPEEATAGAATTASTGSRDQDETTSSGMEVVVGVAQRKPQNSASPEGNTYANARGVRRPRASNRTGADAPADSSGGGAGRAVPARVGRKGPHGRGRTRLVIPVRGTPRSG